MTSEPKSNEFNTGDPSVAANANWKRLPEETKSRRQWALAGASKAPLSVNAEGKLYNTSVNRPGEWLSFEQATQYAYEHRDLVTAHTNPKTGAVAEQTGLNIGYILNQGDPLTCIDIDVKDAVTHPGQPEVWTTAEEFDLYWRIVQNINSFTEYSRSGKGLHIWALGNIGKGFKRDGVEIYSQERFIISTGNVLLDKPVAPRQEMLDQMVTQMRPTATIVELEELDEEEGDWVIYERAVTAANSEKFKLLWSGAWDKAGFPSQSEADLALMSMLTFYSASNAQCRRMFRESGLGQREKATKDDRYLNLTLKKAREPKPVSVPANHASHTRQDSLEFARREPKNFLKSASAPALDLTCLPTPLYNFVADYSAATGFDRSGVSMAAIAVAAAALPDHYQLEVQPGWLVAARAWVTLIGPSAAGKSPIIKAASAALKKCHVEQVASFKASYQPDQLQSSEPPPEPAYFTSDTTIEALSVKLKNNPQGILALTEEFASWIGAIDSSGRGEAAKNRGAWLQLFDGGPYQIDRIGRGSYLVPNWGASVLTATTPSALADHMKRLPEDGLIQRFLPIIVSPPDFDADGDATSVLVFWEEWVRYLLQMPQGRVRISEEAKALFKSFKKEVGQISSSIDGISPALASHIGKHADMVARLALIFHVFEYGGDTLSAATLQRAIDLMTQLRKHAAVLYNDILGRSQATELARALARSLAAAEPTPPSIARNWMTQHCRPFATTTDDRTRREAVQLLEDLDWLKINPASRTYAGWPTEFVVNPNIGRLYAREGEAHRARREAVRSVFVTEEQNTPTAPPPPSNDL